MRSPVRTSFLSAIAGGVVVVLVLLALGLVGSGNTRTVVVQSPMASVPDADRTGLTAHDIYVRDAPGVVFVRSQIVATIADPFRLTPERQRSEATGSGFLIDDTGRILTNYHVIEGAQAVSVQFEDNVVRSATVVGQDPSDDLALLQVKLGGVHARPLELGDSRTVQVGDPTLAIGNPFGLDRTLTSGIVSALQRHIQAPNNFSIDNVIQTDAPINPGNSGGPLLDAAGRVIGINSQIATANGSSSAGNIGIGFAIPIDTAREFLPTLEKGTQPRIAYLGVSGVALGGAQRGVLVRRASAGGPAAAAGLGGGQVIEMLDGRTVASMDDVTALVEAHRPGERIVLRVRRGRRTHDVVVTLATRPVRAPEG